MSQMQDYTLKNYHPLRNEKLHSKYTDTQSYIHRSPSDVLVSAEREKREKYGAASGDRRAIFTPLCVSVDGMMGREATFQICTTSCRPALTQVGLQL